MNFFLKHIWMIPLFPAAGALTMLLFGKRLPDLMRSLGKSITEFKKGVNDTSTDDNPPSRT